MPHNPKRPDGLDLLPGVPQRHNRDDERRDDHPRRGRRRRRFWFALAALAVAVAVAAAATAVWLVRRNGGGPAVPTFRHALVVVFENKERGQVAGNPAAPTFAALARRYATLSAYKAVAHPSLPNYLALVSGSTQGIQSDCTSCLVRAPASPTSCDGPG